jgi:parvulin-like peptidyl-prolyl isomerase
MTEDRDRRALGLLAAGAAFGIAVAAWGVAGSGEVAGGMPEAAVAVVNQQPLASEAFERFAAAVANERRSRLDGDERRRLLERMIDEELLFQRGLELGLARHEPTARRSIVSALIASIASDAEADEPDETTLRAFHAESRERFTRPGRLAVEAAFVSARGGPESGSYERAAEIARRARAGEPLLEVAAVLGDAPTAPLPAGLLPLETLRQYLGPTAAIAAERLEIGEVSDPIRGVGGYHVLKLAAKTEGAVAPFEQVREQVRAEYLRSLGERALARAIEDLRADSTIRIDEARLEAP